MNPEIKKFNDQFKVGDPVDYKNNKGETVRGFLRWNAESDFGGIVWIKGELDAIPFKNVISKEPIKLLEEIKNADSSTQD
jgi:hypothetical protein